jgi:ABC-type Fe3+-hydroxamate transport system substrate-binding protein
MTRVIGEFFEFAGLKNVASASGRAGMNVRVLAEKLRACIAAVETRKL